MAVVLQIAAVEFLEVKVPVAVVVVGCQRFPEVVVAVVGDSTAVCQLVPFRGEAEGRVDVHLGILAEAFLVVVFHWVAVQTCQVEEILG